MLTTILIILAESIFVVGVFAFAFWAIFFS